MIEVIYSKESKIHLRIDGRTYEECNTDQIENATIEPLGDFMCSLRYDEDVYVYRDHLCVRCFFDGG